MLLYFISLLACVEKISNNNIHILTTDIPCKFKDKVDHYTYLI